jgi:hypothetical protein
VTFDRNCEVSPIIDLPDSSPAGLGPATPSRVALFVFDKVSLTGGLLLLYLILSLLSSQCPQSTYNYNTTHLHDPFTST